MKSCVATPWLPSCASYMYPNATSDVAALCMMMPRMSGCSVRRQCAASVRGAAGKPCADFSLLGDVCVEMGGMDKCANYDKLCAANSTVAECSANPPIAHLPTTKNAEAGAKAICKMMPGMSACSQCGASSCDDPLLALGALCQSMPSMAGCKTSGWEAMCAADDAGAALPAYCGSAGGGDDPPEMRMYFHTGLVDYVLWESAVPRTPAAYALACAAIVVAGVVAVMLRGARTLVEQRWVRAAATGGATAPADGALYYSGGGGGGADKGGVPSLARRNAARAGLVAASTTLEYALMLVAMTFNVGLYAAVVGGFALGTLLFGHWGRDSRVKERGATGGPMEQLVAANDEDCCAR